jgi:cytochrome oxidase assembly protein ShyY1
MTNGSLWQNLTWDRLNSFAKEITSLSAKIALPFVLWRNNIPIDSGLKQAEIELNVDEKFKHLGYAVQWVFFGLLSIGLAIMTRRKNKNAR